MDLLSTSSIAQNTPVHLGILILGGVICLSALYRRDCTQRRCLPPGPKGLPFLGNIFDLPIHESWKSFYQWREKWGDIIYLRTLRQDLVILNALDIARDMLDRRSHVYSDRPRIPMADLVGWNRLLALTPYGTRLRTYRKLLYRVVGTRENIQRLLPAAEIEAACFLKRLLKEPANLRWHIQKTTASFILEISNSYTSADQDDEVLQDIDDATKHLSLLLTPGKFWVNEFPILRYVPEWMPFAKFKRTAREWRTTLDRMIQKPWDYTAEQSMYGTTRASLTTDALQSRVFTEDDIKFAAASLFSGGSDTSASTIHAFFLAMTLYPNIQKAVQLEIDRVVGPDRLPTYADRDKLPYLEAVIKEVLRCFPAAPLGAPHRLMEDDEYKGYVIPKGCTVIPNIWAFLHDPTRYSNPTKFEPRRFLPLDGTPPEEDPNTICFGFGRRACPGAILAEYLLYIRCAATLAVFDICQIHENGKFIEPFYCSTVGAISHPMPFQYVIRPRSARAEALVLGLDDETGAGVS
ncbi:cytochrome P450 [Neolentinus lepideus HHB14362 ss-1]|uniref:Cytochrome P450 n=1 Tax=Neolentinus lepideus HHB14362 ss-1 TaxID=1314782 RepID=A0A165P4E6_9AGAM|nr:cytochrome P450 [Neolentinus lepideus HHB14362 ss-1]